MLHFVEIKTATFKNKALSVFFFIFFKDRYEKLKLILYIFKIFSNIG